MLAVSNLSFEYADRPLLHDLNFTVSAGQLLHIKGQNGAGKSTVLKLLAGLLHPLTGEILFEGVLLQACAMHYRAQMSYVGHLEGVHPLLTPKDVWTVDMTHPLNTPTLSAVLTLLQLDEVSDTPFALLSAGQKRRVAMMRLVMKPHAKVWLLDEPWVALDAAGERCLVSLMSHHLSTGGLVVTTSHHPLPLPSSWVSEVML